MSRLMQKMLSMFLALVMLTGMLPMNVLADDPTVPDGEEQPVKSPSATELVDPAVEEVQNMIDALPSSVSSDGLSKAQYEAKLADLNQQLKAIDRVAENLTEEQLAQIDPAKAKNAASIINSYWRSQLPMMVLDGSGTQADPYVYYMNIGATSVNGAELYAWIKANTSWSSARHWYAGDTQFTTGTLSLSGDSSKTFGVGTYAIYGATRSGITYSKDSTPQGYIKIAEVKADEADMTLKDGSYTVTANLKTYSDLTAEKIIAAAVATNNGTVTVQFHNLKTGGVLGYGDKDEYLALTAANLETFKASEDQSSFRLICGNTTHDITVTLVESRKEWAVSYTGGALNYSGDEALLTAVKAGLSITGVGTAPEAVVAQTTELPAVGATGDVTFSVTIAEDDNNLKYSGSVTVSVTMPAQSYTVTVETVGNGTAAVDKAEGPKGTTVTVTATPNDTVNTDGGVDYLKSITVNGTAIEGNTFTIGDADANVVVTFGTRSITAQGSTVYMNSSKDKKDQYVANMIPANISYTLSGDGDQSTVKLQVYANWGLTTGYSDVSSLIGATHCDIPGTKTIKLIWPAEGNLPEVSIENISVKILDSYRTITYMDGADTLSTAGTERLVTTTTAAAPTKTGHTFKEWNTAADGSGTAYAAGASIAMGEDNVTLYAQWTVNIYTITWDANGGAFADGSTSITTSVAYGDTPVVPTEKPELAGTTFAGWGTIESVAGDTTYKAVWANDKNGNDVDDALETAAIQVTITGNGAVALSGTANTTIIDTGDGAYTVIYDSANEGGNVITVTATPNDTVNTDGSVDYLISATETVTVANGETATVTAVFGTENITIAKTGTVYINGNLTNIADKLTGLKAKVLTVAGITEDAANYTVSMVTGTGTYDVETTKFLEQSAMSLVFNVGDSQNFVIKKNSKHPVSDTISITVKDSRFSVEITTAQTEITFEDKIEVADIKDAVKGLFTITSTDPQTGEKANVQVSDSYVTWSPEYVWPADGETKEFTVAVKVSKGSTYQNDSTASVTVTLTDTTILYTVTYLDGYKTEDNMVATYTIAENLAMQTPDTPTREYYTFAGWDAEVAETVTGDVTYTATWTPVVDNNNNNIADQEETYTVVYELGNGEENVTHEGLIWGAETPAIEDPTKEGYNFKGWEPARVVTVAAPAEGNTITYTAQWTQNHAVIFMNGEDQYDTADVENNQLLAEPAAPVWDDDHDFLGWYNGAEKYDFAKPVTESLTLTAKWQDDFNRNDIDDTTEDHFTIVYDVDGVLTTIENVLVDMPTPAYDADAETEGNQEPTKENFKFNGWLPEVAETVTADVTYVAQWLNDNNNNGVDDVLETITFTINVVGLTTGNTVTVNGTAVTAEANTYIYDSTAEDKTITIKAVPATTGGVVKESISAAQVSTVAVDEAPVEVTYATDYSVTCSFAAEGAHAVTVEFTDTAFEYNEERLLNYYPGMKDVRNDAVYTAIVKAPALDEGDTYSIQYLAREKMSQTVQLSSLGLSDTILGVLKLMKLESITIDMPTLWQDVNVETDAGLIQESVSLDQAVSQYLTVEKIESLYAVYEAAAKANGGLISGASAGYAAVQGEIDAIIANIKNAAMYYEAHNFGYNATEAETVTEKIKITYGCAAYYIEGESTIDLKDLRAPSHVVGSNVNVVYLDYTDEELISLIGAQVTDVNGAAIAGAVATAIDITDPYTFEGKLVSDTAYELTFRFAGNDAYKPSEGTFHVTVTKASATYNAPDTIVTYGTGYSMLNDGTLSLSNKYGDKQEVIDSMIQFVIGLDAAGLSVSGEGVSGLKGKLQIILPDELQSMLDGIIGAAGGSVENGTTMSLSNLMKYLEPIEDTSLTALKQALNAIMALGDITIQLGGALPTETGAYLYGAVSTSSNYTTAFDVAYIIIKPNATQVQLDWNYTDTNGVFSYTLMQHVDLGASAYANGAINEDATALVQNLIFGLDANGDLVAKLEVKGTTPVLSVGAYTQMAFIAEFGNEFYYATPIVRVFVIVPDVVKVEIGGEGSTNEATFDNTAKAVDVTVTADSDKLEVSEDYLTVTYTGVQTNTNTWNGTDAPVHAGAYLVTAIYIQRDADNKIITVGADAETLIIKPAASDTAVADKKVEYAPNLSVDVTDMVSVTTDSGVTPDVTIITGTVAVGADVTEKKWEAVEGKVNVDFPAWVDALLKQHASSVYDGMTATEFTQKVIGKVPAILSKAQAKLDELGMNLDVTSLEGSLTDTLNEINTVLQQLPSDVKLTFNDVVTVEAAGLHVVGAVVTDPDHIPSAGAGILTIALSDKLVVDIRDTTVAYNGAAQMPDVFAAIDGTETVADMLYVIVDQTAKVNLITEKNTNFILEMILEALNIETMPESLSLGEIRQAVENMGNVDEALLALAVKAMDLLGLSKEEVVAQVKKVLGEEIVAKLQSLNITDETGIYLNALRPKEVGVYQVYGVAFAANYEPDLTQGVLTIEKIKLTVTLDNQTKTYGDADPELTYTVEGAIEGDELDIVASREDGEDAGTYAITAVVGNTNYDVTIVDAELTIKAKTIDATMFTLGAELTYTGAELTQEITAAEGVTYTVTGNTATDAGDYTMTVTGTGNYTGTVELTWNIAELTLTADMFILGTELTYMGAELTQEITAAEGVTYTVTGNTATDAGDYTMTVTGTGNYTGTVELPWSIAKQTITADMFTLGAELTYTGAEQTKEITVAEGVTYTVTSNTATDAGDYTMTVSGTGNYTGTVELAWNIAELTLTADMFTLGAELTYTGEEQTQEITAAEGVTYTVTGNTATDAGDYTMTVTGTDSCTGTVELPWSIAAQLVEEEIKVEDVVYNGTEQIPSHVVIGGVSYELEIVEEDGMPSQAVINGVVYEVEEVQPGEIPGTYKLRLRATGNYSGELELSWSIKPFELPGANVRYGNSLTMNLFVKQENVSPEDAANDAYEAVIIRSYADSREDTVLTLKSSEWDMRDTMFALPFNNIMAKEMSDPLTVEILRASDGVAVSEIWKDSIRDYAMRALVAGSAAQKILSVDMLNYGAAAQLYFGYSTDDLANKLLTAEDQQLATGSVQTENHQVKPDNYYGTSILMENNLALKMYFKGITDENRDTLYAVFTFTDHYGAAKESRVEGKDFWRYNANVSGPTLDALAVADWRSLVTCTVYNADGSVFATAQDSIESYLNRAVAATDEAVYEMAIKFCESSYNMLHEGK